MRSLLERIKRKISCWMYGRYGQNGQDKLSLHLYSAALILVILSAFIQNGILSTLASLCMILSIYRGLSKNIDKRKKELDCYEHLLAKPKKFISLQKRRFHERKTHNFFKCKCGAVLRVPKGRGKLEITCPQCHSHIIRKT